MQSDLETLTLQAETLFVHDEAKRLLYVNEPERPDAPRFFMGRTREGNVYHFRHDLPERLVGQLEALAASEPVTQDLRVPALQVAAYREVLARQFPALQVWSGPAYRFTEALRPPSGVVRITQDNADLLQDPLLEARLAAEQPCVAVVVENRAVSVCHSARTSLYAAEAGLETLLAFRGRGYAAAAVQGWALAVREVGRIPLYSTSWENTASQQVAAKLGLKLYASAFHLT